MEKLLTVRRLDFPYASNCRMLSHYWAIDGFYAGTSSIHDREYEFARLEGACSKSGRSNALGQCSRDPSAAGC
jgi:hypothetical protein